LGELARETARVRRFDMGLSLATLFYATRPATFALRRRSPIMVKKTLTRWR